MIQFLNIERAIKLVKPFKYIKFSSQEAFIRCCSSKRELEVAYKPAQLEASNRERVFDKTKNVDATRRFSLLLPPPNVTGELHLGHALTCVLQDVMVRWKEKEGFVGLWIPGMDHAGIATQVVVEKRLQKERGLSRHDLGRELFLREILAWKEDNANNIRSALKEMGSRMDWDKEYFTMDEKQTKAVKEAFVKLFDRDLIYRDKALVNWCCTLESAISDIEVDNLEINGPTMVDVPGYLKKVTFGEMVDIAYKVQDSNEEIVISTTRPETLLGDVAVAVNPNDGRYGHLKNSRTMLWHPVRKEEIPLIFDESVDPEFGTGAVKITPAHDRYDYEMAKKHRLPFVEVIDSKGIVLEDFGQFSKLPRYEARVKILHYLANISLLRGTKPHSMILPICSRSKDVIEFLLRPQWFVRCEQMANLAVEAVRSGQLKIIPNHFEKDWFRWLENCHDWCISRQLWWGHQIPAYEVKCDSKINWVAAKSLTEAKQKATKLLNTETFEIIQDPDVLDTWFSSALLPFSALGWPEESNDRKRYYPLNMMETGHDILFFWVARMVMLGQELTDQLPFKEVLLHGIICDENGRKMSKSLGNVIKPKHVVKGISLEKLNKEAEISHQMGILSASELEKSIAGQRKMFPKGIPECGTDALRFTLCSSNVKNHFINFNVQECYTNKLFFNKIWQATRYTLGCLEKFNPDKKSLCNESLKEFDRWILSRLGNTIVSFTSAQQSYNFHLAAAALKTFFYNNFCDTYLETTKVLMNEENSKAAKNHCLVLQQCLALGLYHLEVFTPYLVVELQSHLPLAEPCFRPEDWIDTSLEREMEQLLEICQSIRQAKSNCTIPIARKHNPIVHILSKSENLSALLQRQVENIRQLTLCKEVILHQNEDTFNAEKFTTKSTASHLCSFGVVTDLHLQITQRDAGNNKKLAKLETELQRLLSTVNNEGYRRSASESVQQKHAEKIKQLKIQITDMRNMDLCDLRND